MKTLLQAVMIPAICLTLGAETSGQVLFTVTNKAGVPIKGATILLERVGIKWSKIMVTNDKGTAIQVGLEPRDFNVTVSAEGFAPTQSVEKVPLAERLLKTFVLLTVDEARLASKGAPVQALDDPAEAKATEGTDAYNSGIAFYNEQKFREALPFMDVAYKNLSDAAAQLKDAKAKTDLETRLPAIERVYGIVLAEAAKGDATKVELAVKAEPLLVRALERNPKDQHVATALVDMATTRQDAVLIQKYQAILDTLVGPRPEVAYNEAVNKHNAGDEQGARVALDKAIAMDPKFSDSYYLLGVVQFSLGNTKAAKESFKKYLVVAPQGKRAGEVKEFLKELGK